MALGKSATLYVANYVFDHGTPADNAALSAAISTEFNAVDPAGFQKDANALGFIGDIPPAGSTTDCWYKVCAVDVDVSQTRQFVDSSDRCTGSFGSGVPGQPEWSLTWNAYKKIGAAHTIWQAIMERAYDLAEGTTEGAEVSVLMLDAKSSELSKDDSEVGIDNASGVILVAKVFNLSESQPLNGNIEVSYEIRPSGDSAIQPPARRVTMIDVGS